MPYIDDNKLFLKDEEIESLKALNHLLNGDKGGLVLGPSYDEGGIKMVRLLADGRYHLFAKTEGWQYLVNSFATVKYYEQLNVLNEKYADNQQDFKPYRIPPGILVLDTVGSGLTSQIGPNYLLFTEPNLFFINKYSAWKYLSILDRINRIKPEDNVEVMLGPNISGE